MDLALEQLSALAYYVIDPNKRLFIGYIVGALVFAGFVYFRNAKRNSSFLGFFRYVFPKKLWLHRSAKLDYQLFIVNRLLRALLWAPIVITMVPMALGLTDILEYMFGSIEPITSNSTVVIGSFTLLLFILDDFTRFILHYAMHKIPFLWQFHKVHHSAIVMTPITVYRSHPLESFLYATRMAIAQGTAVGVSYYLYGPQLSMLDILGANVFIFAFNVMGSNLRHSHVRWHWPTPIERWFISPVQHQIHHSIDKQHYDKNFGTALAVWDRLFGCLVLSKGIERIRYGLGSREKTHASLIDAYLRPLNAMLSFSKQSMAERSVTMQPMYNEEKQASVKRDTNTSK
ncbi:sterol desaturase family protein [Agaribacter marinus]|uniref:Fatty acid hydroxylase domain-containing protein n=1 Tax=Agaribacter marinus TaxID=1431249 RepID=A0AA37WHC0_9ALTE|nr:sterol desaturase family protein [Agaribacter marinus]GLR69918.1 hypothetical protein GCM10007852_08260 [Agaribacter marinus]